MPVQVDVTGKLATLVVAVTLLATSCGSEGSVTAVATTSPTQKPSPQPIPTYTPHYEKFDICEKSDFMDAAFSFSYVLEDWNAIDEGDYREAVKYTREMAFQLDLYKQHEEEAQMDEVVRLFEEGADLLRNSGDIDSLIAGGKKGNEALDQFNALWDELGC